MSTGVIDGALAYIGANMLYVKQASFSVTSTTIAANSTAEIFNAYNVSSIIGSGHTLVGVFFNWASGSYCFAGNCQITSGTTIYLRLANPMSSSITVTAVTLTFIYK